MVHFLFRVSYMELTTKNRYSIVKIFVDCPQEVVRWVPQVWAWETTFSVISERSITHMFFYHRSKVIQ
jgi:hypothetical protein